MLSQARLYMEEILQPLFRNCNVTYQFIFTNNKCKYDVVFIVRPEIRIMYTVKEIH